MKLHDYQMDAIGAIKNGFKENFRQYVQMPTGSGKTFTFLYYARNFCNNILVIVPSIQLMNQVYESALSFYHKSEISRKGGHFFDELSKIHICVVHSIRNDYLKFLASQFFDLVIIDEAHHSMSESYKKFINLRMKYFKDEDEIFKRILGMTATPERTDGQFISEILGECSFKLFIPDMIKSGQLCDIEGYSLKTKIDISDMSTNNGDFSIKFLYNKLCNKNRNDMIVGVIKKDMKERKNIVFCINIKHSKEISDLLNENGINSSHIDGTMKPIQRKSILDSFRQGNISTLCNCQLLTEGFDEPSIDGIILARPTISKSLFTQMIGRGLRLFPGKKNCKIIDIVDNHKFLSGINNLVEDGRFSNCEYFKSIGDIEKHITKEKIKISEFSIERTNLFSNNSIDTYECTDSMIDYLVKNNIYFETPLSFDEASFLIWFEKLKKEYKNGDNKRKKII
jgi:ATP-dependent helicase IRC3